MPIGPVEYIIVGFPGNQFTGEIAPELAKLIDSGTIKVIDLVFIMKDEDGNVASFEFDQRDELAAFAELDGEVGGVLSQEDIDYAGDALEPNSSAALLIWEDTWAVPFVEAIRNAGGVLIEGSRVPHELVEAAVADLG
jgi:Family of unknown function (DUF6325)